MYPMEQNDISIFSGVAVWSSFQKKNFYYIILMLETEL